MDSNNRGLFLAIAVIILVVVVGAVTYTKLPSDFDTSDTVRGKYITQSSEWCEEHNGTLSSSNVVGKHGGLHCDLPNGKHVHMSSVAALNYTDNVTAAKQHFKHQPSAFQNIGLLLGIAVAVGAVVSAVGNFGGDDD